MPHAAVEDRGDAVRPPRIVEQRRSRSSGVRSDGDPRRTAGQLAARRGRGARAGVSARHQGGVDLLEHDVGVDDALPDVGAARAGRT